MKISVPKSLIKLTNKRVQAPFLNKRSVYGPSSNTRCLSTHRRSDETPIKEVDIAIFGGGVVGSSVAYWLKQRLPKEISCAVIERDPTYSKCSTTLSVGGFRQQFSIEENIELSLFSSKFIQNIGKYLSVPGQSLPDIGFKENGYLIVTPESGAQTLVRNHKLQTELGAKIELMSAQKLKLKFPWINDQGIELATLGLENEGWVDPWALLSAFKLKSQSLGVNYVKANVIGFNRRQSGRTDGTGSPIETTNEVIIKQTDGTLKGITFNTGIVCCGAFSSSIAEYLGYGSDITGVRSVSLSIEPRKRYVYVIHCADGPGPQSPLLFDSSSVYFRPEGNSGNYLCGRCPEECDEPKVDDLEVDYSYFDTSVWPHLAQRVKAFESLKVRNSWAGFYDYNTLDQNAIVGRDPYYDNIYWATGFSGHGLQMAAAVGMAINELIIDHKYKTIDLSRFGWDRLLNDKPLKELNVY